MKNHYITVLLIAASLTTLMSNAQSPYDSLDINSVNAKFFPANQLFYTSGYAGIGFEVPKGSGKSTISGSKMWIGGLDSSGVLKIAAGTRRISNTDFFPGPLDTANATIDSAEMLKYNVVWKINKTDIDSFIYAFSNGDTSYIIPQSILTWPGNGNPALNEDHFLAPYHDVSHLDNYTPSAGDYPCIKGDEAIFYVFNDAGGAHTESGGGIIGLEIRAMAYAFNQPSDTAVNNTIFVNYQIINRSKDTLFHTYTGQWADLDIGNSLADYLGCDVRRSCYYGYNGYAVDSGATGYGIHPPAQGVVFLKGPLADPNDGLDNNHNGVIDEPGETFVMSNFMDYNNDFTDTGNPFVASQYYNYLKSIWIDGTPLTFGGNGHGGTVPTVYAFPGLSDSTNWGTGLGVNNGPAPPPTGPTGWTEGESNDVPGDRRGIGSCGPFTLLPGAVQCIDYAYVFARDTTKDNIGNIVTLQQSVDQVRAFYNAHTELQTCGCTASSVGVNNLSSLTPSFNIYPNPASNKLIVNYPSFKRSDQDKIIITNALGQLLYQSTINNPKSEIDVSSFSAGIYFLKLQSEQGSAAKMFVKE